MDHREVDIVAATFCAADWRALSYDGRRPYRLAALQAIKALDAHRAATAEADERTRSGQASAAVTARAAIPRSILALSALAALALALLSVSTPPAKPGPAALAEALPLYGP